MTRFAASQPYPAAGTAAVLLLLLAAVAAGAGAQQAPPVRGIPDTSTVADTSRASTIRADTVRGPSRADTARAATLRTDTLRTDTLRTDTLRTDTLRTDTLRIGGSRADSTRADTTGRESPGADAARPDATPPDSTRTDSPPADTARTDTPPADTARSDSTPPDTTRAHPATTPARAPAAVSRPAPRWPVDGPDPLPGAILPDRRIVAYYGNPLSRRMGILGEIHPDSMLARLDAEVAAWEAADPATPVQPALHLVAIVAQADPGRGRKYRLLMTDSLIELVGAWAERRNALVFLDVQVGLSTLAEELPRLAKFLERPNFHLGIDPEFMMKDGTPPGRRIGYATAEDVNHAVRFLGDLVERHGLPPKVLVVHRFTQGMLRNAARIELDPRVQIVIHMDGWGPPQLKRDSYRQFVYREPVQFAGFKVFYRNDTRQGHPVMTPAEILKLFPAPVYIQYQ
ncbi:MAG TPA: hypothetical protein VMM18_04445 [Gemmatimonadaceae bacterium]|nr:hypothetical protein [Gemmatimonadaceae bacterium]